MIQPDGIKNIFFDLGGVLIDLDKEKCIAEFEKLGVVNIDEHIGNSFKSGLFFRLEEGRITPQEFRENIRRMTKKMPNDSEIDYAWNSFLGDIPFSKLELLRRLNKRFRVFMVSNTNAIHFDYMIKHRFTIEGYTLNDYFEKCYLSYELHISKPDRNFFAAVVNDAKIVPHESLFLDDNAENIKSAEEFGFQTYLVKEKDDYTAKFIF